MSDVDRAIEAAVASGEAALERIRTMHRSLDRADAAQRLSREMRELSDRAAAVQHDEVLLAYDAEGLSFSKLAERFGISKTLAYNIVRNRAKLQADEEGDTVTEPSSTPEPEPVVAAIVTSHAGVLVGKRTDGTPPWTFIAGKIEPGESPADAAVREVKEETGLRIRAGGVIGRRIHPKTGRAMVYIAARPTHGTGVFVGDADELTEVRWVSADEADGLMDGAIFGPVRQHIRHMLRNDANGGGD